MRCETNRSCQQAELHFPFLCIHSIKTEMKDPIHTNQKIHVSGSKFRSTRPEQRSTSTKIGQLTLVEDPERELQRDSQRREVQRELQRPVGHCRRPHHHFGRFAWFLPFFFLKKEEEKAGDRSGRRFDVLQRILWAHQHFCFFRNMFWIGEESAANLRNLRVSRPQHSKHESGANRRNVCVSRQPHSKARSLATKSGSAWKIH
jgi:hypothetical protein